MDENLMEFWGKFLLEASRSRKQMGNVTAWIQQNLQHFSTTSKSTSGFDDYSAFFQQFCDPDQISERSTEYQKIARNAAGDFQKSFEEYLSVMGVVSKKEYLEIVEKYEKLKEKSEHQEETIRNLRLLRKEKYEAADESAGVGESTGFEEMIREQGAFFQKMVTDFSRFIDTKTRPADVDTDSGKPKKKETDETGGPSDQL